MKIRILNLAKKLSINGRAVKLGDVGKLITPYDIYIKLCTHWRNAGADKSLQQIIRRSGWERTSLCLDCDWWSDAGWWREEKRCMACGSRKKHQGRNKTHLKSTEAKRLFDFIFKINLF